VGGGVCGWVGERKDKGGVWFLLSCEVKKRGGELRCLLLRRKKKLFFLVFMKSLLHRKQKRGQLFTTGGGGGEGFPPNLFSTNGKLLQYILK
jgi:hypothetical protein